MGAGIFLKANG